MSTEDKVKFAQMIYGVGEYYNKDLSTGVISLYWESLKAHPYEDLSRAVARHMEDPDGGQFMPKIADIKRHIGGSKQTQAMQAWTKVDKSIRQIGPWVSVCFDDPIINRVLSDMGGWISMCDTPTEKDLEFKMHEFNKRYQGYVLQGGVSEYPKVLIGHTEAHNNKNGHNSDTPMLIGSAPKAQLVFERGQKALTIEARRADQLATSVVVALENKTEGAA